MEARSCEMYKYIGVLDKVSRTLQCYIISDLKSRSLQ